LIDPQQRSGKFESAVRAARDVARYFGLSEAIARPWRPFSAGFSAFQTLPRFAASCSFASYAGCRLRAEFPSGGSMGLFIVSNSTAARRTRFRLTQFLA